MTPGIQEAVLPSTGPLFQLVHLSPSGSKCQHLMPLEGTSVLPLPQEILCKGEPAHPTHPWQHSQ